MAFGIKGLKPEIDKPKYYLHIVIVTVIAYYVMKLLFRQDIFVDGLSVMNVLKLSLATTLGDIVAHSILKLD